MRARVAAIVEKALGAVAGELAIGADSLPEVVIEKTKREEFGDFSTNVAMTMAKSARRPPRELADKLRIHISKESCVERCETAGPGFINIFLKRSFWLGILGDILSKGERFGMSDMGAGEKVQVEFVSANPTGPLHIGHGRGAAVGDALANVLEAAGYEVTREFYVNDRGRQIETLGRSVYLRYLELLGERIEMPEDAYKGDYIRDVARDLLTRHGEKYRGLEPESVVPVIAGFARDMLLERIEDDLKAFGVRFDVWYSEAALYDKDLVDPAIEELRERGFVYDKDGAVWFRTTEFGDDKDRVLVKENGDKTYLASDVAYHRDKAARGFDRLINVWGADHHGYESRIRAVFRALGLDDAMLGIIFIQLVSLLRARKPVAMGKREGEFVTLREVVDEVGADASRFFFLMRKADAQLDFDLDLAKSRAPENPVYYVQYCHARIHSIMAFAAGQGMDVHDDFNADDLEALSGKDEIAIIKHLGSFEEVVERSARSLEPHRITFYLMDLAGLFHPYYNRNRVVTDDAALTRARLLLCRAVARVAANGLAMLGVSAPEKM